MRFPVFAIVLAAGAAGAVPAATLAASAEGASAAGATPSGEPAPAATPETRGARVAAGMFHTCAVGADGRVWCWGHGVRGNLGDGGTSDRSTPVTVVGLAGAVEVAAGEWFTCAREADGTVWCWGGNENGQLGNGSTDDARTPTRVVGIEGAEQIAAGERMACARTREDVLCWGQLGFESRPRPLALGIVRPRAVSVGAIHGCAVGADARLRCFGANYSGQLGGAVRGLVGPPLTSLGAVGGVSAGGFQTCAWTAAQGALYCWGNDDFGSFAPFRGIEREPVAVTAFGAVAWARSGYGLTCALGRDRKLRCRGSNVYGQLGGHPEPSGALATVPLSGVVDLAVGGRHLCATLAGGEIDCWGANYWGELGDGTTRPHAEPRPVKLGPAHAAGG